LQDFWPRGPYGLGGHCNGAAIAFEMARRLVAQHREVASLMLVEPPIGQRQALSIDRPRTLPMLPPEHMRIPQIRVGWLFSQYRAVMQHYQPEPYVGAVDLFWAKYREEEQDPRPLLEPLTRALTVHLVPGTHVTALGRHVRKLAAEMARCLR
jgi:thioesterase superfamily protein